MKNKICTARDKDGILKRGEYTGYSDVTKKHHVSFYDGKTNAFDNINAIALESVPVFETGATSAAVNELILYTDNTRELVELRDKIYESCKSGKISPYNMHYQFYYDFYKISAHWYETEIASETVSVIKLSSKEQNEFATIYANRFADWKKERERNPQ